MFKEPRNRNESPLLLVDDGNSDTKLPNDLSFSRAHLSTENSVMQKSKTGYLAQR